MKQGYMAVIAAILLFILYGSIQENICSAQTVTEPPVPIHIYYQDENLAAAYKDSLSAQKQALEKANKQIDTLKNQIQRSPADNPSNNLSLYIIISVLGSALIILFLMFLKTRKELTQNKKR